MSSNMIKKFLLEHRVVDCGQTSMQKMAILFYGPLFLASTISYNTSMGSNSH